MKKSIYIFLIFLNFSCSSQIQNKFNKNNYIYSRNNTINDPIEPKISSGNEIGNRKTNVIFYDSTFNKVIKGWVSFNIEFDNLDSMKVVNSTFNKLILKDSISNEIIFNCRKNNILNKESEKKILLLYEEKMTPIVKKYKYWIDDRSYSRNFSKKIEFFYPFTIYPFNYK